MATTDYKREDYEETVNQVVDTVIRNWLLGEGDLSWLTLSETLYELNNEFNGEEEEAIIGWIEEQTDKALLAAKETLGFNCLM